VGEACHVAVHALELHPCIALSSYTKWSLPPLTEKGITISGTPFDNTFLVFLSLIRTPLQISVLL
jgi:hypothetical protein